MNSLEQAPRIEKRLAATTMVAAFVYLLAEVFVRRSGWARIDEFVIPGYVWAWLDGASSHWSIATGSVSRWIQSVFAWLMGPKMASLRFHSLGSLLLECTLLWLLAKRFFGERAAVGAVLFTLACGFTLLRARSLLSWALLPAEFLLVIWLATTTHSRPRPLQALSGLLAGFFTLDYEIWSLALPVLGLCMLILPKNFRPGLIWWKAAGLGVAVSIYLSIPNFESWWTMRSAISLPAAGENFVHGITHNLSGFFLGGTPPAFLGLNNHPSLPIWSFPLIIIGTAIAWKRARWLLAITFLGFLPLAASSAVVEPNRAIAAWPGLCLLAGLGWQRLSRFCDRSTFARVMLILLATGGFTWEVFAFEKNFSLTYSSMYGDSQVKVQALDLVRRRAEKQPLQFIVNLDYQSRDEWSFLEPNLTQDTNTEQVAALIPWHAAPAALSLGGELLRLDQDSTPLYILFTEGDASLRLRSIDSQLKKIWRDIPIYNHLGAMDFLEKKLEEPGLDPWVRTALWSALLIRASLMNRVDEALVQRLLAQKDLISAQPFHHPGLFVARRRPDLALKMLLEAERRDPRLALSEEERLALHTAAEKVREQ